MNLKATPTVFMPGILIINPRFNIEFVQIVMWSLGISWIGGATFWWCLLKVARTLHPRPEATKQV